LDTGNYLKLLPHLHQTDGFFAAVFEKFGTAKTTADTKADKVQEIAEPDEAAVKAERKKAAISKSKAVTKAAAAKESSKKTAPKKVASKKAKA
jgi:16S rRNA (cytosine967-C5)-methyltransferase